MKNYYKFISVKLNLLFVIITLITLITGCQEPEVIESQASGNQNPIINRITTEPNPVNVGNICLITVDATDPQNSPLTYEWYATIGSLSGSGNIVQYNAVYCCAGSVRITVTVRNNIGGVATQNFFINVIQ